jgi:chorismate synthase
MLKAKGIEVIAHVSSVGKIDAPNVNISNPQEFIEATRKEHCSMC